MVGICCTPDTRAHTRDSTACRDGHGAPGYRQCTRDGTASIHTLWFRRTRCVCIRCVTYATMFSSYICISTAGANVAPADLQAWRWLLHGLCMGLLTNM